MSALFSIAGKVALVTGGGAGIGLMVTKTLVAEGAKTYIVGRNAETLAKAAAELAGTGTCIPLQGDLSTVAGAKAVAAAFAKAESKLDILVNNAGVMYDAPLAEFTEEGWDSVIDLNLKSVFFFTQALLPQLHAGGQRRDACVGGQYRVDRGFADWAEGELFLSGIQGGLASSDRRARQAAGRRKYHR